MVNNPAHYTSGRVEAIDVIEDAIEDAPNIWRDLARTSTEVYAATVAERLMLRKMQKKHVGISIVLIDSLN